MSVSSTGPCGAGAPRAAFRHRHLRLRRRHRRLRLLRPRARRGALGVLVVLLTSAAFIGPCAEPAPGAVPAFAPPVDAPVIDSFRPPENPYGPGNRGWEYDTEPDAPITAAGSGVVSFAGQVGGPLHVTISHGGGLRTSYSYLASIDVTAGAHIDRGARVGTAGDTFHFGARLGDRYIDPALLFEPGALVERARLVR
jgi:murein DD-endopeptidase MepM/ murein hydrolase activator NlpD